MRKRHLWSKPSVSQSSQPQPPPQCTKPTPSPMPWLLSAGLPVLLSVASPVQAAPTVAETGHPVSVFATTPGFIEQMAFDSKGNLYLSARTEVDVVKTGTTAATALLTGLHPTYALGVGPDDTIYISESNTESGSALDGVLYSYTAAAGKKTVFSGNPLTDPIGITFAPSGFGSSAGKMLLADWNALSGPGAIFVLDPKASTPTPTVFAKSGSSGGFTTPTDVKFAPDGKCYAIDESVGFFGVSASGVITLMASGKFTGMAIHPSTGEIFATGANGIENLYRITVNSSSTATVSIFANGFSDLSDGSAGVTFTPDGGSLLVGDSGLKTIYAIGGFPKLPNYTDNDSDGYTEVQGDCNDANPAVHPGLNETCNAIDDDCDGAIDEGFDADLDGYTSCGTSTIPKDCDDSLAAVHPGATEVPYDGLDNDCSQGDLVDVDNDGYASTQAGGFDCDDANTGVNPGVAEICQNGVDDNCSGAQDDGFDQDSDGHLKAGTCPTGDDCNDQDAAIYGGATETCDAKDNDCDLLTDEGFDQDGDGHLTITACAAVGGDDCDDQWAGTYPGATELCDGRDNDCNYLIDDPYPDLDEDGLADCIDDDDDNDGFPSGGPGFPDCNDLDPNVYPGAAELCDGMDDDCDGVIDNGYDQDSDGHLDASVCAAVGGDDCNDSAPTIYTGALETCDGLDNNCNGVKDEGFDQDGDLSATCSFVSSVVDCNDNNASIYPSATDVCEDSIDQNCDGTDEQCPTPTPEPATPTPLPETPTLEPTTPTPVVSTETPPTLTETPITPTDTPVTVTETPTGPTPTPISPTDLPGTDTPGTSTPGTATPGTATPGTATPGTDTPGTDTPPTGDDGTPSGCHCNTPDTSSPSSPALVFLLAGAVALLRRRRQQ